MLHGIYLHKTTYLLILQITSPLDQLKRKKQV